MPSKSQTIKIILRNVAVACVAIIICGVIIFVSSGQISGIVSAINQTRATAIEGQDRSIAISELQDQFGIINGNDAKIDAALMHENNIIPFINALTSLASKGSVQQTYSFSAPAPYASQGNLNVYSIPYTISLTGNFNSFVNYLNNFQNLPYFTYISSINVSTPLGLGQGATMSMNATLYVQQ